MEPLVFPLENIPNQGISGRRQLEPSWFSLPEEADDPVVHVILTEPVDVEFSIEKAGRNFRVRVAVRTSARLSCSRCLEAFTYPVDAEGTYVLSHPVEGVDDLKEELTAEDLDLLWIRGEELNLLELVYEQIVLSFPIKPLCSESCLGLCPRCGANLNMEPCGCERDTVDPRWEVLKGLKLS